MPRGGLRINLDAVCASTRDEYPDPKSMCSGLFGVLAYSFQPARHRWEPARPIADRMPDDGSLPRAKNPEDQCAASTTWKVICATAIAPRSLVTVTEARYIPPAGNVAAARGPMADCPSLNVHT